MRTKENKQQFILDFFTEVECPFCRSVRINVVDKLQANEIVYINNIDVDANSGAPEMAFYRSMCREMADDPTPLLRLHDKLYGEDNWEAVFLMWRRKPTTITQEVLSSEEYLEKQLYDKIREMSETVVEEIQTSYEWNRDKVLLERGLGLDRRIY